MEKKILFLNLLWPVICLLSASFIAACTATGGPEPSMEHQAGEHTMEHDEAEHSHQERIPNEGAVIKIIAPANGAVFKEGDEILVEVTVENFALGENGNHWHVYVDGQSFGMVTGGDTDQALRGLEPGQHEISAYLSLGTHEELEDGAKVTITVVE